MPDEWKINGIFLKNVTEGYDELVCVLVPAVLLDRRQRHLLALAGGLPIRSAGNLRRCLDFLPLGRGGLGDTTLLNAFDLYEESMSIFHSISIQII